MAAGIRLRGAAAVQLEQRQGISRVEAILQSHPALQRKLTAEQIGILEEAEAAQTDGLQLGVHLLVEKAQYMAYNTRPATVYTGACGCVPCSSPARSSVRRCMFVMHEYRKFICIPVSSTALACLLHMGAAICLNTSGSLVSSCNCAGTTHDSSIIDKCLEKYPSVNSVATPITAACLLVHAERLSCLTPFDVLRLCTQEREELRQQSHARRAHLLYHPCSMMCHDRHEAGFDPADHGNLLHLAALAVHPPSTRFCADARNLFAICNLSSYVHPVHVLSAGVGALQ